MLVGININFDGDLPNRNVTLILANIPNTSQTIILPPGYYVVKYFALKGFLVSVLKNEPPVINIEYTRITIITDTIYVYIFHDLVQFHGKIYFEIEDLNLKINQFNLI